MTLDIIGYQIVLLDAHDTEVRRLADMQEREDWITVGLDYRHVKTAIEEGQQVRYFKRIKQR